MFPEAKADETELAASVLDKRSRDGMNSAVANRGALAKGNQIVIFYNRAVEDEQESAQAGRPIYKPVVFVKVVTPGDRDNIIDRVAWLDKRIPSSDINRFRDDYAAFFEDGKRVVRGTPLTACTFLSREQIEEVKRLPGFEDEPVVTVEQLSELGDDVAARYHLVKLKHLAKDFLESSKGMAGLTSLRHENEKLRAEMEAQARQLAELSALVNAKAARRVEAADETGVEELRERLKAPVKRAKPKAGKRRSPAELLQGAG
jgi:hypothetical protein